VVAVSAVTGEGCDDLVQAVGEILHGQLADVSGQVVAINARHRQALQEAQAALERARGLCDGLGEVLDRAEVLALELREAVHQLGMIVGQVVTEDLLDRIFANFCIGK
jgi:tRNA modification GTPase